MEKFYCPTWYKLFGKPKPKPIMNQKGSIIAQVTTTDGVISYIDNTNTKNSHPSQSDALNLSESQCIQLIEML